MSGTLQPVRQAIVKAKVAGDIRQITIREGETVQAGQMLVRIDTTDLDLKLIDRVGALESAKRTARRWPRKPATMNVRLMNDKFISQNAFDSAESSFSVAQGSVKSMEAQVQLARNALKDAVATAPLAGIVAKRHVQPGEKVAIEAPLVTIVDLKDLEVQAMVPAIDVPELKRRHAGRVRRRRLRRASLHRTRGAHQPVDGAGTRALIVYVGLPNSDAVLRSGMFATGRIALAVERAGSHAAGYGGPDGGGAVVSYG